MQLPYKTCYEYGWTLEAAEYDNVALLASTATMQTSFINGRRHKIATILPFKIRSFKKFRQISSKIDIFGTRVVFLSFHQFFVKNEILWSLLIWNKMNVFQMVSQHFQ